MLLWLNAKSEACIRDKRELAGKFIVEFCRVQRQGRECTHVPIALEGPPKACHTTKRRACQLYVMEPNLIVVLIHYGRCH